MSLIVISVDNSGIVEGSKGEDLPLTIIFNNEIIKRTLPALVSDCSTI